jgi:hypothetical protein
MEYGAYHIEVRCLRVGSHLVNLTLCYRLLLGSPPCTYPDRSGMKAHMKFIQAIYALGSKLLHIDLRSQYNRIICLAYAKTPNSLTTTQLFWPPPSCQTANLSKSNMFRAWTCCLPRYLVDICQSDAMRVTLLLSKQQDCEDTPCMSWV